MSRSLRLECGERRNALTLHRFDDEGGRRAVSVPLEDGVGRIEISDRLTVLELPA